MNDIWLNFAIEIALFSFLGILYYFYQKRKIIHFEENKTPLIINYILEICLSEKSDVPEPELDHLIIELDNFISKKTTHPPFELLKVFSESPHCSARLKEVISNGLRELGIE